MFLEYEKMPVTVCYLSLNTSSHLIQGFFFTIQTQVLMAMEKVTWNH